MKIYTSYWAKASALKREGLKLISISRFPPRYVGRNEYETYIKLAPHSYMLKLDHEEYYKHFNRILDALTPAQVVEDLARISGGKDVVLLCYEKNICDCHRGRVVEWLRADGFDVNEYVFEKKIPPLPPKLELF